MITRLAILITWTSAFFKVFNPSFGNRKIFLLRHTSSIPLQNPQFWYRRRPLLLEVTVSELRDQKLISREVWDIRAEGVEESPDIDSTHSPPHARNLFEHIKKIFLTASENIFILLAERQTIFFSCFTLLTAQVNWRL